MAPAAVTYAANNSWIYAAVAGFNRHAESALLHRNIKKAPLRAIRVEGNCIILEDGRRILDAAGGAAVACLGYQSIERINAAITQQQGLMSYVPSHIFTTEVAEDFGRFLIDSTKGKMAKFCMYHDGSVSMDAAVKLAIQYHQEKPNPELGRINLISREGSYHGNTGFALSLSGHRARRRRYEAFLQKDTRFHRIPAVYPYRDRLTGESDEAYIERKAKELDQKIEDVGPKTVAAFAIEPVGGATQGSTVPPKGYLRAIEKVCRKHGVLIIFDEIMCGMGRMGTTLHAWQREGVVPDIQAVGKSLAGGYQAAAGILVGHRIVDALWQGTGAFMHGHTYQNHSMPIVAAFEVQKYIKEKGLLENVRQMGELLQGTLKQRLRNEIHVGDVRGDGLLITIEFVQDKATKECFPRHMKVVERFFEMALNEPYNLHVYSGCGEAVPDKGEGKGDHIMLCPPFNITRTEILNIVDKVCQLIHDFEF
ncbi:aminotransferase [Lophiostoma macrostomum CBS 122681]|uniref:Aminotransferase n=1 Tax=Lophiostoma macrostomum CBS 122681 TaxID=1314788 RepID=A0A6A6TED3_9PLEO|nr:aminotransferase [Lophiostoma macrostomum CBS 122681]